MTNDSTPHVSETITPPPLLQLQHNPGYVIEHGHNGGDEDCICIFESEGPMGFSFSLWHYDKNPDSKLDVSLRPLWNEYDATTPDDISHMGDECDQLQQWFYDCSTVFEWARAQHFLPASKQHKPSHRE